MSWSVSAVGTPEEVRDELHRQFQVPFADPPAGLSNQSERDTVNLVSELLNQVLGTFCGDSRVSIIATGHMGECIHLGGYQSMCITVTPQ